MTDEEKTSKSPNNPVNKNDSGADAANKGKNENKGNRILKNAKRRSLSLDKQEEGNIPASTTSAPGKSGSKRDRIRERVLHRSLSDQEVETESQANADQQVEEPKTVELPVEHEKPSKATPEKHEVTEAPTVEPKPFASPIAPEDLTKPQTEKPDITELRAELQESAQQPEEKQKDGEPQSEQLKMVEQPVEHGALAEAQGGEPGAAKTQPEKHAPVSDDLLLTDVRQSLIEDEAVKQEKKQRNVLYKVSKLFRPDKTLAEDDTQPDVATAEQTETPVKGKSDEAVEQKANEPDILSSKAVESFFDGLVESSQAGEQPENVAITPPDKSESAPLQPEETVAGPAEELPREAETPEQPLAKDTVVTSTVAKEILRPQAEAGQPESNLAAIREVALEDYGTEKQPESIPEVTWQQRLRIIYRDIKPFERTVILGVIGLMFLSGILGVGFFIVSIQKLQLPAGSPTPTLELPFPTRVTLPGGWDFNLRKGHVVNGVWTPSGPEWLAGTELCKWVAVPYSVQLEAVLRTFKPNDPIELTMSNADKLTFKVQSIKKVAVDQTGTLEKTSNCLLLILAQPGADSRWVVTAVP